MLWWTGTYIFFLLLSIICFDALLFSISSKITISAFMARFLGRADDKTPADIRSLIIGFIFGMLFCHFTGWGITP